MSYDPMELEVEDAGPRVTVREVSGVPTVAEGGPPPSSTSPGE